MGPETRTGCWRISIRTEASVGGYRLLKHLLVLCEHLCYTTKSTFPADPEDPVRRLAVRFVLPALLGLLVTGTPGHAQLSGWSVSATADFGAFVPLRQLGKNSSTILELSVLQVVANRETSSTIGGGVTFTSPTGNTLVRARYSQTLSGVVVGRLGVCGSPDEPLFVGELCDPVETQSDIQSFQLDLGFMQGSPTARVRPSVHIGVGIRSYSFTQNECDDPIADRQTICEFSRDIWAEDGGLTPFLMAGLRLSGDVGPANLFVESMVQVGPYKGGANGADGNVQNDMSISGGFMIRMF